MMRSDDYLIKRAEIRMESYIRTADKTAQKISDVYQKSLKEICKPLESIYSKLSVGITVVEAKRILNKLKTDDIELFFNKAIDNISDDDKKKLMQDEFKKPAIKAKVNQIKQLTEKIKTTCKAIIEKTTKFTGDCLNELIPYAYYHSAYDEQHSVGIGKFLLLLTKEQIDEIRLTNWSGIKYPDRIKNNGLHLSDVLIAEVLTGFFTKKNQVRMAEIMAQRMSEAFNRSYTLLRTEACFVTNQAELQSYVDNGIEKYRYVAVLDMRTSKMCRELDGQVFDVDKAIIGINFPPLHPHCRSITRPVIDGEDLSEQGRNAIDPETGDAMTVPADMTYNDWYEKYVDKSNVSDIIKNISLDDIKSAISGGKIQDEVAKTIFETLNESNSQYLFNAVVVKKIDPKIVMQTDPVRKGTFFDTKLNLNENFLGGKTVEQLDKEIRNSKKTVANSLKEATIHEKYHAKLINGLNQAQLESLYDVLSEYHIDGISPTAYIDGSECIAEIGVLLERGETKNIPKEAVELFNKYMGELL